MAYRILIVDDNESIHDDLKKILLPAKCDAEMLEDEALLFGKTAPDKIAFTIDSAFQGQEGLKKLQQATDAGEPYALAFVDVRMPPGWDGIETISRLWACDPELQVVICTAYSDYNWDEIQLNLGLSHNLVVLKKPFDPIEVKQLAHALTAKWDAANLARTQMEKLDRLVEERTSDLLETVKQLDQARKQAEVLSLEDPLTKLPNRRLFLRHLAQTLQIAKATPDYHCAVLFLDIDRFKIINDSLGHIAGDELLVEMAKRLRSSLREAGCSFGKRDLIARLGGDEFAILLDGVRNSDDAVRVSKRIRDVLSAPFDLRGRELFCTVSVGIVTSDSHYQEPESMMRDADAAMYRAKANGGGVHSLFDDSMHRVNIEKLHKESEVRQALDRKEFFLVYQPIVSLITGEVEGFEALLRWQSPTRGLVNPAEFIPLCEETGLIIALGKWVLEEACRQVSTWRQAFGSGFDKSISINISARQFLQSDLVDTVEQAMQAAVIDGSGIRLELTETVTMQDPRHAASILSQFQQLGVRLSIDDFGTGYSSLDYLDRFSVDTLKIDQSFVRNMTTDRRKLNIVRTIVSLAHNLQMGVIAEGAETLDQVKLLISLGCDSAQGYFFSRPVKADQIDVIFAIIAEKTRGLHLPEVIRISA
ncbi:MAG: EAL domain-containing protein [Terracidiphilus sp.]